VDHRKVAQNARNPVATRRLGPTSALFTTPRIGVSTAPVASTLKKHRAISMRVDPTKTATEQGVTAMDVYTMGTEKIISLLEQGVILWRRPWNATAAPRNLLSKKTYRGVNFFLMSATTYVSPYWLTLRQTNDLGESVRKGEHGQVVVFWKVEQEADTSAEPAPEDNHEKAISRRRFALRFYRI
jgi:hypothetical protein